MVALPEEMPLEEAATITERLRGDLGLPVGRLVMNQCRPQAPPGAAEAIAALRREENGEPARGTLAIVAQQALGWLQVQEEGIGALERRVGLPVHRLPRLFAEPLGRADVEHLADGLMAGLEI